MCFIGNIFFLFTRSHKTADHLLLFDWQAQNIQVLQTNTKKVNVLTSAAAVNNAQFPFKHFEISKKANNIKLFMRVN